MGCCDMKIQEQIVQTAKQRIERPPKKSKWLLWGPVVVDDCFVGPVCNRAVGVQIPQNLCAVP